MANGSRFCALLRFSQILLLKPWVGVRLYPPALPETNSSILHRNTCTNTIQPIHPYTLIPLTLKFPLSSSVPRRKFKQPTIVQPQGATHAKQKN